jgi:PEP-CTERM motif
MKKYLVIIPLLFVALAAPATLKADQAYNVNLTVGSETVTGTIVTDGNMGTLSFTDVNSFSFGLSQAGSSSGTGGATAKGAGKGGIVVTGDAVTATSAGLFFNFDTTDPSSLEFQDANDAFLLCLFTDEGCDPPGSGEVLTLGSDTQTVTGLSGHVLIASTASATAPEPGTFALMLIGIVGLISMLRKSSAQGLQRGAGTHR